MTVTDLTNRAERVRDGAYRMRHHVLEMGEVQGQGYVGQALGVADMLAVTYLDQLRSSGPQYDETDPGRDRFLLSTGHYAIALYAALVEAGVIERDELATYGADQSRLPMSAMASYTPGMEISGGSLGHGLGVATGMALGLRHTGSTARTFCFLSDGELNEGSTWEAAMGARHHRLGNLVAMVDMNALQADGSTESVMSLEGVKARWAAFGWRTERIDGNDPEQLVAAFDHLVGGCAADGTPAVVLCDTQIGHGVPLLEARERAHFMHIDADEWQICRDQLDETHRDRTAATEGNR